MYTLSAEELNIKNINIKEASPKRQAVITKGDKQLLKRFATLLNFIVSFLFCNRVVLLPFHLIVTLLKSPHRKLR